MALGAELRALEPLVGNSARQSVMYFPPNTPIFSISGGRELRPEIGIEALSFGLGEEIDVPALHAVVYDDPLTS